MAFGSGSKRNRDRAVLVQLDEQGDPVTDPRHVDLSPLYSALRREFADLNIEGAFVAGGELCLLQRGNLRSPVNACVRYEWHAFERWLRDDGPVPTLRSIVRLDLGQIEGVPLCFTDGAALPGGGWVFCAAAEATADSYTDGRCVGSAVGVVSASGALIAVQPLGLVCKTEGITATVDGDRLEILLVTDTDDRSVPAQLLSGSLPAH